MNRRSSRTLGPELTCDGAALIEELLAVLPPKLSARFIRTPLAPSLPGCRFGICYASRRSPVPS